VEDADVLLQTFAALQPGRGGPLYGRPARRPGTKAERNGAKSIAEERRLIPETGVFQRGFARRFSSASRRANSLRLAFSKASSLNSTLATSSSRARRTSNRSRASPARGYGGQNRGTIGSSQFLKLFGRRPPAWPGDMTGVVTSRGTPSSSKPIVLASLMASRHVSNST
jgi:hypothetical protein